MAIASINGSVFFGASEHIKDTFAWIRRRNAAQTHLMLLCDGINFVDLSGAETLAEEAKERQERGGTLLLVGIKDNVHDSLTHFKVMQHIHQENLFDSKVDAISEAVEMLDTDICASCSRRIFRECAWRPGPD